MNSINFVLFVICATLFHWLNNVAHRSHSKSLELFTVQEKRVEESSTHNAQEATIGERTKLAKMEAIKWQRQLCRPMIDCFFLRDFLYLNFSAEKNNNWNHCVWRNFNRFNHSFCSTGQNIALSTWICFRVLVRCCVRSFICSVIRPLIWNQSTDRSARRCSRNSNCKNCVVISNAIRFFVCAKAKIEFYFADGVLCALIDHKMLLRCLPRTSFPVNRNRFRFYFCTNLYKMFGVVNSIIATFGTIHFDFSHSILLFRLVSTATVR